MRIFYGETFPIDETFEFLLANITGAPRRVDVNGRAYLVASLVSLVPGVLAGSKGPLYYPPDEAARNVDSWNGMPLTIFHPTVTQNVTGADGITNSPQTLHVSARTPEMLIKHQVGTAYSAAFNARLLHEAWFDVQFLQAADRRFQTDVYNALLRGEPMEVSTGLYTQNIPAPPGATHNGKPYAYTARNYRPDHIAILPRGTGACSRADGCGLNVNQTPTPNGAVIMPLTPEQRTGMVAYITANCDCWKDATDTVALNAMSDEKLQKVANHTKKSTDTALAANCLVAVAKKFDLPDTITLNADSMEAAMRAKCKEMYDKEKTTNATVTPPVTPPVTNATPPPVQPPKPATLAEFEAGMPPEARAIWNSAKDINARALEAVRRQLAAFATTDRNPQRRALVEAKLAANLDAATYNELAVVIGATGSPTVNTPPALTLAAALGGASFFIPSTGAATPGTLGGITDNQRDDCLGNSVENYERFAASMAPAAGKSKQAVA
jgi:hypothetical protein